MVKTLQPRTWRWALTVVVLLASCVFLFARLGHYALWYDEALTALGALGVWRTGDTTAMVGSNIVAYRGGIMMSGGKERGTPPLPFYLTAPFVGVFGQQAWAARLPFALLGLATVAWVLWWLWRDTCDPAFWMLMGLGLITNVSFFLYCQQSRYYAPAIFATLGVAYLYLHWDGIRWKLWMISALSVALLASNYMEYVALYVCLAVDYLFWGRKRLRLTASDWLHLLGPQVVLGALIVSVWNPLNTQFSENVVGNTLAERARLVWWTLRDINTCEFGVGALVVAAPLLWFRERSSWLLRAPLALLVYVVVASAVSPQPVREAEAADVRYVCPVILLCIATGVLALAVVWRWRWWVAVPLALVAFASNLLNVAWLTTVAPQPPRSTLAARIHELLDPPPEPFSAAAGWINQHIPAGTSVWVLPHFMAYPLVFHAPHPLYAWQLRWPPEEQFQGMPLIHFQGMLPPDYIIVFGPMGLAQLKQAPMRYKGRVHYEREATIDCYWFPGYRPEVYGRHFRPRTNYDRQVEVIQVLRRTQPETLAP
jgi:hypothetical protein